MKKVFYLTFNDAPSGIYAGQVIDVCRYWQEALGMQVTLVAFISLRGFFENKKKIRSAFPGAVVIPMVPRARNWRLNRFALKRIVRRINPSVIVARGPFAAVLAMQFREKRKICFDGRGAYTAELKEYNVVPDEKVKNEIFSLEKKAVLESDFRLAVSQALVNYWKKEFNYSSAAHVVVPCTLNRSAFRSADNFAAKRKALGYEPEDIVIVYSGSGAGWQSLQALDEALLPWFEQNGRLKLLLLLKNVPENLQLKTNFSSRVKNTWLRPEEVQEYTSACDYGWLVREQSVTNAVASPVKFAEYLAAGLRVIISPGLGDYSEFVRVHSAGICRDGNTAIVSFEPTPAAEKERLAQLAAASFTKETYREQYLQLLS